MKNSRIKKVKAMLGSKISLLRAREILDSRGNWTIGVELLTKDGLFLAGVPSGASKGRYEAKALEARKAVRNINKIIAPKLIGKDPSRQKEIDDFLIKLDGTKNKSKLGANAICGVSMAVCRAGAVAKKRTLYKHLNEICKGPTFAKSIGSGSVSKFLMKLPLAAFNVINGGAHAGNDLNIQEFMIVPQAKSFSENLKIGAETYLQLKKVLAKKYGKSAVNLGDEGGFAPPIALAEEALDLILQAVKKLGYQKKIKIILDAAASQFYFKEKQDGKKNSASGSYKMKTANFDSQGLLDYYSLLVKKYPIIAIEDPFDENDWAGFERMTKELGKKITVIGDDLLVTNPEIIKKAKNKNLCNGLLLKVNQIGTVSEALQAANLAKSYGWKIMVSHRSGETNDDFIADLAVGIGADFIKSGAPARGERVAKYNRLLRIEKNLLA